MLYTTTRPAFICLATLASEKKLYIMDRKFIIDAYIFTLPYLDNRDYDNDVLLFTDTRYGLCYDNIDGDLCSGEMPVNVSKSSCCCAVGSPAAWSYGGVCESCPSGDNPIFELLCHMGIGYVEQPDGSIIGE